MRKTWIITDTHFNHKKLIEWGRPVDFEEQIWKNLKRYIKPGDMLIHLGDICIGKDEEVAQKLNLELTGVRKILVRGNHDNKSYNWYLDKGWDMIVNTFTLELFGKKILFSHYPMRRIEGLDLNLHGHMHGNGHREDEHEVIKGWNYDCAPDTNSYKPLELESLLSLTNK